MSSKVFIDSRNDYSAISGTVSILEAIYLVAGLASIGGFSYAIYYARKSRKIKFLVYQTASPVALATAFSPEDDYKLGVTYQRKGFEEERFESVYTRFLRFANLGKESIRHEDITRINPIKIKIEGVRTLDIALVSMTRTVNNITITNQSLSENSASADLTFDYLDYKDGGLIKILTVGGEGVIALSGDVIGMPDGIKNVDEAGSESWLSKIGTWLAGFFVLSSLVVSIFSYYWTTGSWHNAWLLALPFIALIVPIIIILFVSATIWPSGRPSFPAALRLPEWFHYLQFPLPRNKLDVELRTETRRGMLEDTIRRVEEENKLKDEEIKRLKEKSRWTR